MRARLSPVEAIMWRAGQDAALRMTVGDLLILDRAPSAAALEERLSTAADSLPRLRRRPDDPTGARALPAWVDDPDFDAGAHLGTMAVPPPGGTRQLLDLVALLEPRPFDPERPPWDATLIEGLEGGRAALYLRAHHAVTDGPGGTALVSGLLDPPDAPAEAAPDDPASEPGETEAPVDDGDAEVLMGGAATVGRKPGTVTLTIDLTRAAGAARDAAGTARDAVVAARTVEPLESMVRTVQRGLDAVSSVSRQVVVVGGPLSTLPSSRSVTNHFEVISVADARATALALGGSRNDLLVAAAAAGLGAYHEHLGFAVPELRMSMPAGRRRDAAAGGNWFAPTRVVVPTAGEHPGPFFGVVAERLARARHEPAVPLASLVAAAISLLPMRALRAALHTQARSVDFVATCFAGMRQLQRLCGTTVEQGYPFGPRLGCLMNITAVGNGDRLDIGVTLDPTAVTDPSLLLRCLGDAFHSFATGRVASGHRPRAARS